VAKRNVEMRHTYPEEAKEADKGQGVLAKHWAEEKAVDAHRVQLQRQLETADPAVGSEAARQREKDSKLADTTLGREAGLSPERSFARAARAWEDFKRRSPAEVAQARRGDGAGADFYREYCQRYRERERWQNKRELSHEREHSRQRDQGRGRGRGF